MLVAIHNPICVSALWSKLSIKYLTLTRLESCSDSRGQIHQELVISEQKKGFLNHPYRFESRAVTVQITVHFSSLDTIIKAGLQPINAQSIPCFAVIKNHLYGRSGLLLLLYLQFRSFSFSTSR